MIYINGKKVEDNRFPDGTCAIGPKDFTLNGNRNTITWFYDNDGELFKVLCIVDTIKRYFSHNAPEMNLNLPYVPNARMDRIKDDMDNFSLKTFANLINSCGFNNVSVLSPHSDVTSALINNIHEISLNPLLQKIFGMAKDIDTIFFPDAGAMKRYAGNFSNIEQDVKLYLQYAGKLQSNFNFAYGEKDRDWSTGKIKSYKVVGNSADLMNKNVLIIDDICSKGGTFKYAAIELKKMGVKNIYLFIAHCENVIDIQALSDAGITCVYTTDSIYRLENSFVKVLNLEK